LIKHVLESTFPRVRVAGEISNFARASSGHLYFTLKDESAQLRAVCWRGTASRFRFQLHDGLEVVATGPLEVYTARGSYQLVVEALEPVGVGALELAFRQLVEKLGREGLFAPERKRPLPRFPRRIAVITSPTGAAVRDMIQVLLRRWPAVQIVIVPAAVQGDAAPGDIAAALRHVHSIPGCDVAICGRGGGSAEDLWAFNDERVARAIFHCRIPVVSAVGHEIDVTIADLVADKRALTPSEAAEFTVPNRDDVAADLAALKQRLIAGLRHRAAMARSALDSLASSRALSRPFDRIHDLARLLDELDERQRRAVQLQVKDRRHSLDAVAARLHALSPLAVLSRGFSLTRNTTTGRLLKTSGDASPGDEMETRLSSGRILSRVEIVIADADVGEPRI
jgi:exodeoxyribonuclease VII large subunit